MLSLASLKRSFTGPVACGTVRASRCALPFLALPLGGAVASVADEAQRHVGASDGDRDRGGRAHGQRLGQLRGLEAALGRLARRGQLVVGVGDALDGVLAGPAVDDVALAVGDGGDRVVAAAGLRARRSRSPSVTCSGVVRRVASMLIVAGARCRCARAGASAH